MPEVERLWLEILGDDLIVRRRMSRIFYGGTFFDYPLRPLNALRGLGLFEAARVLASYAHAQLFPVADERTFDAWVSNRFGRRLFEVFFKTYTEKVWGMPCSEISAAWAAQRIKNLDLMTAVRNALLGSAGAGGQVVTSLIERFHYPRLGPGMMWERCRDLAAAGGVHTHLRTRVVRGLHDGGRVHAVDVLGPDGATRREPCDALISTMPVGDLVRAMDPAPPAEVLDAAGKLRHRDFLPTERAMLPEEVPATVEALYQRATDLARALHAMDTSVDLQAVDRIEDRMRTLEREPEDEERSRRVSLLQRQRKTIEDLRGRREQLASQLESCSLAMQNVRFDLLRLRSSDATAALGDLSTATRQARALSRDVDNAIEAAGEVRDALRGE